MKLFLGGGGGKEDSIELDKRFVDSLDISKPLLYIPIATNTAKYPYSGCIDWISNVLGPLGVRNIVMWVEEDLKTKKEEDFNQFSGIYIGGGNTFKLLKELREFGTLDILKSLAKKDIPIYGGSAGAIIFAKTITPSMFADKNDVGLSDFSAINLVDDCDIWCHYLYIHDETIRKYMNEYNLKKIIALPENSGIFVSEKAIEVVGYGRVKIFDLKERDVYPGDVISTNI